MKRTPMKRTTPLRHRRRDGADMEREPKPRASKEAKEDAPRKPSPRKCDWCGKEFSPHPSRPLANICKPKCALDRAKAKEQAEKERDRQRRDKIKSRSDWEAECRAIVQKIARIRDRNDGCISCNLPATWDGQWHGSHFRSHGAASAVQLHLWNIHKSCSACNLHKSGNLEGYRPRLIAKIGQAKVDWLLAQNDLFKPPMDYYPRFKRVMGKRLRRMERALKAQREAACSTATN